MQSPINIIQDPKIGPAVSGRELYGLIAKESSKAARDMFADWFRERQKRLSLVENVDFYTMPHSYPNPLEGGKRVIEFILTLKTVKVLAKYQPSKRGMPFLNALNAYERSLAEPVQTSLDSTPTLTQEQPIAQPLQTELDLVINKVDLPGTEHKPALTPFQELLQYAQEIANRESEVLEFKGKIDDHTSRLIAVERKVDALTDLFRKAAAILIGDTSAEQTPAPEQEAQPQSQVVSDDVSLFAQEPTREQHPTDTLRAQLVRVVADYTESRKTDHREVWRWLYAQLNNTYHFNVNTHKLSADKTYLDVVERNGYIRQLYNIANSTLVPKASLAQG